MYFGRCSTIVTFTWWTDKTQTDVTGVGDDWQGCVKVSLINALLFQNVKKNANLMQKLNVHVN